MTVQLNSLRYSAELNVADYTKPMSEKVAADKAGAASSETLGAALVSTDTKISRSGDILTQLQRKYKDGAREAMTFNAELKRLGMGMDRGNISAVQATEILDGLYRKFQLTADATSIMERGQLTLAAAVEKANAKLLEQQKVQPANNNGRPVNNFQAANVAYQLQDVFSTAALGSSALTVALQQGPQLASVFGETGAAGAVKTLGAAFLSVISPVSLVTIGLTGVTAAAIQYFTRTKEGSKTADDAIKAHAASITAIKDAYGAAADGLGDYVKKSQTEAAAAARQSLTVQQQFAKTATSDFFNAVGTLRSMVKGGGDLHVDAEYAPFKKAISDLRDSVKAGTPEFSRFRSEVVATVAADPTNLQKLGDKLMDAASGATDAERRVRSAKDIIAGMGDIAGSQVSGVNSLTEALKTLAGISMPSLDLTEQQKALTAYRQAISLSQGAEDRRSAVAAYDAARERISNSPEGAAQELGVVAIPTPGQNPMRDPSLSREDIFGKPSKSVTQAADAYRDLVKNAKDRIEQMNLEASTSGETGIAAETLRFKMDLLQKATDKGRKSTKDQRDEINALSAAYSEAATKAAKSQLNTSLQFERDQMGRSSMDQTIAGKLQSAGLPVELNSVTAAAIRTNEQLKQARDLAGDFTSSLTQGLRSGEGLWKSFGNAALTALNKITDTLLNDTLNAMFKVNQAGAGGGGILSTLFGASQFSLASSSGIGLYDGGGFTGVGGKFDPAGIVHRGEFVFDAEATRRLGVGNLQRLQRGYADGGLVGGPTTPGLVGVGKSGAQATHYNIDASTVINAPGADETAIAKLRADMAKRDRELPKMMIATVKEAQKRRIL